MINFQEIETFAAKALAYQESVKNNIFSGASDLDAEARVILSKIDDSELHDYLYDIIKSSLVSEEELAFEYYHTEVDYIFDNFLDSELDEEFNNLKKEIALSKRADNSAFSRAYMEILEKRIEGDELILFLVKRVKSNIQNTFRDKNKVIEISKVKQEIRSSVIYSYLFDNIENFELYKPTLMMRLFASVRDYNEMLRLLLGNDVIFRKGTKYFWKGSSVDSALQPKKLMCCLGIVLSHRNYLKETKNTEIVKAFNEFFEDGNITKTIYGRYRGEFEDLDQRKVSPYYQFYSFIPIK